MRRLLSLVCLLLLLLLRPALAANLQVPRASAAAIASGPTVTFIGGRNQTTSLGAATSAFDVFDASSSVSLLTAGTANKRLARAMSVLCGGTYHLVGGVDAQGNALTSISTFANGILTNVGALSVARTAFGAAATTSSPNLYVGGGLSDTTPLDRVDVFDCEQRASFTSTLSSARSEVAAAGGGDVVIFAGGSNVGAVTAVVDVCKFKVCSPGGNLSVARTQAAAVYSSGYYFVAGGIDADGLPSAVVDVFIALASGVQLVNQPPSLRTPAYGLASLGLAGTAVFAGGYTSNSVASGDIALLAPSPVTGGFTVQYLQLSVNRTEIAAVATSAYMIFAGGTDGSFFFSTVDAFALPGGPAQTTTPPAPLPPTPLSPQSLATTTTTGSVPAQTSPPNECVGGQPVPGAQCINGRWMSGSITADSLGMAAGACVFINGTLTLTPTAEVSMAIEPTTPGDVPLTVTGAATLGGTLVITLSAPPRNNASVTLLNAAEIRGNFTDVRTEHGGRSCVRVRATPVASGGSLAAVFSVRDACGLSNGAVAGIVVGGVVALAIGVVIVAIVLQRRRVAGAEFLYRAVDDDEALR